MEVERANKLPRTCRDNGDGMQAEETRRNTGSPSKRYQVGCLYREKRKARPDVWVFRFRDGKTNRKKIIGTVEEFSTKTKAFRACELLRANINKNTGTPRTIGETGAPLPTKRNARRRQQVFFHANRI